MTKNKKTRRPASNRRPVTATGRSSRTPVVVGVVVVLVLAAAVVGGALWVNAHKTGEAAAPIPAVTYALEDVPVTLDEDTATVLVGAASARVTVDLYEDFLCPACRYFEQRNADRIHEALAAGQIRVRYHLLNLLDDRSDPPGYSLLAASAALAVADAAPAKFLDFYGSLFAAQPAEGARGYDAEQLTALGHRLGVTDDRFAAEVADATFGPAIRQSLSTALGDPALRTPAPGGGSSFGTPTVAVDGTRIAVGDPDWLPRLTAKK